jgi:hypothetical protein
LGQPGNPGSGPKERLVTIDPSQETTMKTNHFHTPENNSARLLFMAVHHYYHHHVRHF